MIGSSGGWGVTGGACDGGGDGAETPAHSMNVGLRCGIWTDMQMCQGIPVCRQPVFKMASVHDS